MEGLRRFCAIVRVLAAARPDSPLRLTQIAESVQLSKPTASRLLTALCEEGLVRERQNFKAFELGPELMFLGWAAARGHSLPAIARPALERLAAQTGDTAYLTLRAGYDSVCGDVVLGTYPVRTMTIDVGNRRPLGIGAASLALLAALPETERELALSVNAARYEAYPGFSTARLRKEVTRAHSCGYALTDSHLVPGVTSLGVVIADKYHNPIAAVSVAAVSTRFAGDRTEEIAKAVRRAATAVRRMFATLDGAVSPHDELGKEGRLGTPAPRRKQRRIRSLAD